MHNLGQVKNVMLMLVIAILLSSSVFALGNTFKFISPAGLITMNTTILQGTNINCANITGAGYDVCVGDGGAGSSYDLNITSDSGSGVITDSNIFSILGAGTVSTSFTGTTLTITGSASGVGADQIGDFEMNYSDVTLADFTNDAGFITSASADTKWTINTSQLINNSNTLSVQLPWLFSYLRSKENNPKNNTLRVPLNSTLFAFKGSGVGNLTLKTTALRSVRPYLNSSVLKYTGTNLSIRTSALRALENNPKNSSITIPYTQITSFQTGVRLNEANPTNSTIIITESQVSDLSHFTNANEINPTNATIVITESQISDLSHTVDTNTFNSSLDMNRALINNTIIRTTNITNNLCIQLTGSADLCDGNDATSAGGGDGTGGWTNTTTHTSTNLQVNITGNLRTNGTIFQNNSFYGSGYFNSTPCYGTWVYNSSGDMIPNLVCVK